MVQVVLSYKIPHSSKVSKPGGGDDVLTTCKAVREDNKNEFSFLNKQIHTSIHSSNNISLRLLDQSIPLFRSQFIDLASAKSEAPVNKIII